MATGKKDRRPAAQAAWRIRDFEEALKLSHTTISDMVTGGTINSVLLSPRLRIITESPEQFLARRAAASAPSA